MPIRYLINNDGARFESTELTSLTLELDSLDDPDRENYRNKNAEEIAKNINPKTLIVSGPGTGKSYLFLDKINNWFKNDPEGEVLVTSFVRKLVADLQSDIDASKKLSKEQKNSITATTLHKYARSIVEKNHGSSEFRFKPHFKIIGESWKDVVWNDVLFFFPALDYHTYNWRSFESQLHNNQFESDQSWIDIKDKYFELCSFYNAAGFADLIIRAKIALDETPSLNTNKYFIVDEYQDFNLAEDSLISNITSGATGILIVGDDEQVLYDNLKSGKADLIRGKYNDTTIVNAMLPFCGRCSSNVTKTTSYFIQQCRGEECISKIYLPLKKSDDKPKIQIIACATPSTAIDYIEKYISDNQGAIDERKTKLETGDKKDAYLLILTPSKKLNFLGKDRSKIFDIVAKYQPEDKFFSDDYYKVLTYYSLAKNPHNNFSFRKVLHYEAVAYKKVHILIETTIAKRCDLCDLGIDDLNTIITKADSIKTILESDEKAERKIELLSQLIEITDKEGLKNEFNTKKIGQEQIETIEHKEEEDAELEEIEVKRMGAVELLTLVGSKGLSADNVIVIGFDEINMGPVTKNAFYVAMTRARDSLHLITSLKSGGSSKAHDFLEQLPEEHIEFYSYKKTTRSKTQINSKSDYKQYLDKLNSVSRRRI